MIIENIDEISRLSFDDYYGEMGISKEQISRRKRIAERALDAFLLIFAYYRRIKNQPYIATELPAFIKAELIKALPSEYKQSGTVDDPDIMTHISLIAASVANSIMRYGEGWYTDYDNAWELAANEGNSIENRADYVEAVKNGFTKKTWHTILDGRERETHMIMDGKTIPINDYFNVGFSIMKYPRDDSMGAAVEEIANCRCHVSYS